MWAAGDGRVKNQIVSQTCQEQMIMDQQLSFVITPGLPFEKHTHKNRHCHYFSTSA